MKILHNPLLNPHVYNNPKMVSDYQSDCVLHGFRELIGKNYHEVERHWWMYSDEYESSPELFNQIWGRGFSLYGLLPEHKEEMPTIGEVEKSYNNLEYDYIFIPIHHTMNHQDVLLSKVIDSSKRVGYKTEQIVIIDGWDRPHVSPSAVDKCGYYFKRELDRRVVPDHLQDKVYPLSFAIPAEKITTENNVKKDAFAPMIPAMHSWGDHPHLKTYKYNNLEDYYQQYKDAYFAYTCKKAGWDCMRHYEILANGCIPWFTDIEHCPDEILTQYPKDLCIEAKKMEGVIPGTTVAYDPKKSTFLGDTRLIKHGENRGFLSEKFRKYEYSPLRKKFLEHTRKYLTTKALANYILGIIT